MTGDENLAGFFGLFDYTKPGKGVSKEEVERPRFVHFFKLLLRKFWLLVQLNLLYLLFCIPVVTIGPATAGLTFVLRNMATDQAVFLFSDFMDSFKSNWKQALVYSLILAVCMVPAVNAISFYTANAHRHILLYLPVGLSLLVAMVLLFMSYYVMLMIVTLALPLGAILKNAAILAVICLKTNLLTLLFTGLLVVFTWLLLPYTLPVVLLILPALTGFIVCYNSYPGIKKHVIDPFEAQGAGGREKEKGPALFRDEHPLP